jgi:prepilin-type N-terminal cleavage/methylation domain-containing protein
MHKNKRGFTVIELIAVICVLGILVSLALPRYFGYTNEAKFTRLIHDAKLLEEAATRYYLAHGAWPRASDTHYTKDQVLAFSPTVYDSSGRKVDLDPDGHYYDIDFKALSRYITIQSNPKNFILENPEGAVYVLDRDNNSQPENSNPQPQVSSITLTADLQTATIGTEVTITALLKDNANQPVSGVTVHFETTLGTISPEEVTTDQNGNAAAVLTSSLTGTATVTATVGNLTAQQEVTFYANGPQPLRQPDSGEIPIRTPEELAKIGVDSAYPLSGKYILMANLDLSSYNNWNPIGNNATSFTGQFDGNGLVIKNLTINRPSTNYQGLFGYTSSTAKLMNIGLENVNVTGYTCTGGLVGENDGIITSSYSTGSVMGTGSYTGGLVGINYSGTVTSSYSTCSVTGTCPYTGGLAGDNYSGTITSSYSTGSVTGVISTGGLVGGNHSGTITNSYSTGSVTGGDYNTGGLVGENSGTITSSYSTGSVTGVISTGGLVGINDSGTITSSYSTGSVHGNSVTGGLVGENYGTITNSYSKGSVTGDEYTGGLVGYNDSDNITSSYWDTQTSDQASSAGGVGKTTAQMKQQSTFTGWDFTNIWAIDEGVSYPYLRSNEQIPHPGTSQ